jgi:hypothetical protein
MLSALEVNLRATVFVQHGGSRRAVRRGSLALKRHACHGCSLARLPSPHPVASSSAHPKLCDLTLDPAHTHRAIVLQPLLARLRFPHSFPYPVPTGLSNRRLARDLFHSFQSLTRHRTITMADYQEEDLFDDL